ncbi:hypothetical protein Y695_01826 [Hydrogenophaga sp. T4]|nr:hypothetical protein Y695_01826 [Hydrogenophaga sp. T4]
MAPKFWIASSIMACVAAGSDRSAPLWCTFTPCSCDSSLRSCSMAALSPKPLSTMSHPAEASAVAIPRPIPLVDPVTRAVFLLARVVGWDMGNS